MGYWGAIDGPGVRCKPGYVIYYGPNVPHAMAEFPEDGSKWVAPNYGPMDNMMYNMRPVNVYHPPRKLGL